MSILLKISLDSNKKFTCATLISALILACFYPKIAFTATGGLNLSYGTGKPDHLKGYRIGLQSFWPLVEIPKSVLNLTGYWDFNLTNWTTSPPQINQPRHISIVAASPVIRLQTRNDCILFAQPYLELGIGVSLLSNNHVGHRNLGGQFAFQDFLGIGLRWKGKHIWSLSYHYVHYSNAHLLPPNQGIDVKHLFSLGYEFN